MKKQIGIVGYFNAQANHFGVGAPYMKFFSKFGDVTIISPTEDNIRKDLDLVVVPGGPDVDWKRYVKDGNLSLYTGRPCNIRERFDEVLLPKYIDAGIPIFGICRGHQSIAVLFGAELEQDMYHETNPSNDRTAKVHTVLYDRQVLSTFMNLPQPGKKDSKTHIPAKVNSIHHQMVMTKPENALVLAEYKGDYDGLNQSTIEALYYPEEKIATVQWHPEEIEDVASINIINFLLNAK